MSVLRILHLSVRSICIGRRALQAQSLLALPRSRLVNVLIGTSSTEESVQIRIKFKDTSNQ